jgi:hypothetical protein
MAMRSWALGAAAAAGIGVALAASGASAASGDGGGVGASTGTAATTTPGFVGTITSCSTTVGSVVAVDFGGADVSPYGVSDDWGGPVALGCDTSHPKHGINLLNDTGFTTTGDGRDGPAFVCRIAGTLFDDDTPYPTPAQDPCIVTPPATAYWSYWSALAGQDTWAYNSEGVDLDKPKAGEVEAWTFGGTDVGGTTGQPSFTPDQIRAQETDPGGGGGTTTATPTTTTTSATPTQTTASATTTTTTTSTPSPRTAQAQALASAQAAAARYLATTTSANGVTHGTSLARAGYYEAAPRFADFGLTFDGAFALVAAHQQTGALHRVITFIADGRRDGSHRSINTWTEIGTRNADGGSIGKEALFAEVIGRNPRHFAGHNLITALNAALCTRTIKGVCAGGPGSFHYGASTFDQTLALMAMLRAGDSARARPAIAFLERQQHRSGAWPSLVPSTGDSDADSTAMAAMTLALLPHNTTAARDERRALTWLAGRQEHDGGFPGAAGDSTNSAALAIQALELGGSADTAQIQRAQTFLIGEQNRGGGFAVAAGGPHNSDVRASAQALGGLVGTSFGTLRLLQ